MVVPVLPKKTFPAFGRKKWRHMRFYGWAFHGFHENVSEILRGAGWFFCWCVIFQMVIDNEL